MARPRAHLRNAPIVEAVIDFRVVPNERCTADTFADLESSIGARYTQKFPIRLIQGGFGVDKGELLPPAASQMDIGWRYQAEAEVAQFRVGGFTFSKIEPYTSWEQVFEEAFRLWAVYVQRANPRQVSRIAVRYINRMRLSGGTEIGRYLEAPPILPTPIPQELREFLTRVRVEDERRNASAVIVQALEPQVDRNAISLLLDIDAFCEVRTQPDDAALPDQFEQLRQLKNEIFYASITEATAEMYE
ncbi:MAG: TIGR04255 family protein [Acidobacteriaceae bacterium]